MPIFMQRGVLLHPKFSGDHVMRLHNTKTARPWTVIAKKKGAVLQAGLSSASDGATFGNQNYMESIYDIWEFPVGFRISMCRHRVRPSDSIRKATALRCRCQTECFAVWMIAQIKLWACIVLQGSEPPARCLLVAGSALEKERPVLAQRRKRHSSAIKQDYPGHPMVRFLGTRTKWKLSYSHNEGLHSPPRPA